MYGSSYIIKTDFAMGELLKSVATATKTEKLKLK